MSILSVRHSLCAMLLALPLCAVAQDTAPEVEGIAPPANSNWTLKPNAALPASQASRTRLLSVEAVGKRLVAVGQQGVIIDSEDGGASWKQVASPVNQMLNRIRFSDDKTGWILGYDSTIMKSDDAGKSWELRHFNPKGRALYDLLALDANRAIAVGAYGTYLTTRDGGKRWSKDTSIPVVKMGLHLDTLTRLGDGSLFMTGEKGLMARSTDEGATWQMLRSPYIGSFFGALPVGEKGVVVHGLRGNVFVTRDVTACPTQDPATWDEFSATTVTDAGELAALGWRRLSNDSRESLFGATSLPGGRALLVGVNGLALVADLDKATLTPVKTPSKETLVDVLMVGDQAIAVGKRGVQNLGAIK